MESAPHLSQIRSPLAAQSKVDYRKSTPCVNMSQRAWHKTDGAHRVGTLDPLDGPLLQARLDAPFHGNSTKGNLYTYIHKK